MENLFNLSDEKLKILLEAYFNWSNKKEEDKKYPELQKQRTEKRRETLLNKEYLSSLSDEELVGEILKYVKTLEGPVGIRLGKPRVSGTIGELRRNLLYIINSPDDPFKKASRILEGDYKIPIFAKAFWSPLFQAQYPELLPNWNKKTRDFLKKLGIKLTPKKTVEERYKLISEAFRYLKNLNPKNDFYYLDHLTHYGIAIDEGIKLIDEMLNPPFKGFTEKTFQLLDKLSEDTSYESVMSISEDIQNEVIFPLKNIFKAISLKFDQEDKLNLEKENDIMGRLFKPNSKDGSYPYVWGAFYQKKQKKDTSMQFFVWICKDYLTCGIYYSKNNSAVKNRIIKNLIDNENELRKYFNEEFFKKNLFFDATFSILEKDRKIYKVSNITELIKLFQENDFNIGQILTKEEVIKKGTNIVDTISTIFEHIVPSYVLGVTEEPIKLIKDYYEPESKEPVIKVIKEEVLKEIFLKEEKFNQICSLLENRKKKQIIFQGPPGTGKTFVAQNIALYLTQSGDRIETIQFHPSYSYEDFIEGYRPKNGNFELEKGIFREFCQKAREDKDNKYILIIDEINRGNLSKIFGELLYLLEYRDKKAKLTYSQEEFSIPENVYIIGTMNTADRSLAIMDYALRRRFYFVDIKCETKRLEEWLNENGSVIKASELIGAIENMNNQIKDEMHSEDFAIGHSYFMREGLDNDKLKEVMEFEVKPLLKEYFFDKEDKVEEITGIMNKFYDKENNEK